MNSKHVKSVNAVINDRIQELAEKAIDANNSNKNRDMNDLMTLLIPKLRFYVWGFLSSEADTDDVLFNALEKICIKMQTYDPAYRFTTWVYTIAKREALTWLEGNHGYTVDIDKCFYNVSNMFIDRMDVISDMEAKRDMIVTEICEEIQRIAIEDGNVMLMEADINDRKGKEIAEMYGISENTVKTRIRAGRKLVRNRITAMHPDLNIPATVFGL